MRDGRPLRFLTVTIVGWVGLRAAMLVPGAEPLEPLMRALAPPLVAQIFLPEAAAFARPTPFLHVAPLTRVPRAEAPVAPPESPPESPPMTGGPVAVAAPRSMPGILTAPLRPTPIAAGPGRLAGSAWLLARGGAGGTVSGGQLGASQAGVRLTYALGHGRRVAIAARLATPLSGTGKEAAIGLEWKPTRLPFRLIAEQRFVLDGGRGGPTIGVIGGYGPAEILPGVRIEAYGQAGAIARDGVEGFIDTAARLTHPTARIGHARLDLGLGAWGSAQRGAARFDLGPTAGLALPVAGRNLRLALDWRQRLAGAAHPGSGPAFTIGSDF
ncbi:hypothetical protein [Sphingomonas sp. GC_Shp_6]|uniref:hypothetical protein n=1 Tax=Sphingomonas sp. GC_Shp_6 TaxID=2937378 RepID=UPI00226A346A